MSIVAEQEVKAALPLRVYLLFLPPRGSYPWPKDDPRIKTVAKNIEVLFLRAESGEDNTIVIGMEEKTDRGGAPPPYPSCDALVSYIKNVFPGRPLEISVYCEHPKVAPSEYRDQQGAMRVVESDLDFTIGNLSLVSACLSVVKNKSISFDALVWALNNASENRPIYRR